MKKASIISWIILLALTLVSALFSNLEKSYWVFAIMILATIKFCIVAFEFMDLKKANSFWKILLLSFMFIFNVLVFSII